MTDRELINIAVEAAEKAYAPYSKFAVGAALECDDGTVFTGCNIENASYGCTNCAERTAVFKAVSEGKREFRRIAIFADTDESCMPCGTCRQVLNEFAPTIEVLSVRRDGRYVSYSLKELLPKSFSLKD
ncbi:MAG: cytidine deaminase [Oscillospiraceae bacterium]|nr:cytidine deaminase [Oscillospiraceae bacterium]